MNETTISRLTKVYTGATQMNVLICDDEPSFCDKVSESVTNWFNGHDLNVQCVTYTDPTQVLNISDLTCFQIAFLDVEMKPLNGIELGKLLKRKNQNLVIIYVSAYLEFAIDGYSVDAFRYILKRDFDFSLPACLTAALKRLSSENYFFSIKKDHGVLNIHYDDIYYFQSDLRKVYVFGEDPNTHLGSFYDKLSAITPKLESLGFLQTGRSYLVNMLHIEQIVNYTVILENGVSLSASRTNYSAIQKQYLSWKGRF